jgi:hypothetical protein
MVQIDIIENVGQQIIAWTSPEEPVDSITKVVPLRQRDSHLSHSYLSLELAPRKLHRCDPYRDCVPHVCLRR